MSRPVRLFISYAERDRDLIESLQTHLALLRRQKLVEQWDERPLFANQPYGGEIDPNLERADIVLLLVTPSFMSSSYCYEGEMTRAMELHKQGLVRVIPIIGRPGDTTGAPFSALQGLPTGGKPITKWTDPDEAWLSVVQGLRQVVQVMKDKPPRLADAPGEPDSGSGAKSDRKPDRNQLLGQLERMLPPQFEKVIFFGQVPTSILPGGAAAQTSRAIDLIRYFGGQGEQGLVKLETAIRQALKD